MRGFYGHWQKDAKVVVPFNTNEATGGSVDLATDGTIKVYKDDSTTAKTSSSGIVFTEAAYATGVHQITLDTSDNTDAGYWATGSIYHVQLDSANIDGQTVNHMTASFALGQMVGADSEVLSNASVVAIVNRALIAMGEEPITSLTEAVKPAQKANSIFAAVRDSVLQSHYWHSALKLATLAELSTAPAFGFTKAYQLPADFIRLYRLNNQRELRQRYRIRGRELHTSETSVQLEYVARIEDPNDMSPMLKDTISASLAVDLSLPITGKQSVRDRMEKWLSEMASAARNADSAQIGDDTMSTQEYLGGRLNGISMFSGRESP